METPTKVEFAVQMTCQSCVDAIKNSFKDIAGVQSLTVNLAQEQVIVESILTSFQIQEILEQTGWRAVLKGQGSKLQHLGAAVSVLEASAQVKGVVRMTQVDERKCIIEGTLDGLRPGSHGLAIHEFGDISDGCNSCGGHFNPFNSEHGGPSAIQRHVGDLGNISAAENGRARFRIENDQLKVWDVIGRSFVVHEREDDLGQGETPQSKIDGNSGPGLACGIIARSAGLFENNKRICACDGVSLWDERDVPLAGPDRQQHPSSAQSNL
ncbi:copper chaperone for superoxide dismutase-like isoform X3 [Apostichopus japonicus]|uniref:copper chaperone for superoxide dismutase-like isoform X1 n=1 Tax=Stichopus japonicus TaxID=307972 RepID=UPI003AB25E5D